MISSNTGRKELRHSYREHASTAVQSAIRSRIFEKKWRVGPCKASISTGVCASLGLLLLLLRFFILAVDAVLVNVLNDWFERLAQLAATYMLGAHLHSRLCSRPS